MDKSEAPDKFAEITKILLTLSAEKIRLPAPATDLSQAPKDPRGQIGADTQKPLAIPLPANEEGCHVTPTPVQFQPLHGTVVGFLTREEAIAMMQRTQAALRQKISPHYVMNQRAKIHIDGSPDGSWVTVLLPKGMTATVGDHVEYLRRHDDPAAPCHYIPNMIAKINPQ
jgi:hypothetical protein